MTKLFALVAFASILGCMTYEEEKDRTVEYRCSVEKIEGCQFVVCGWRQEIYAISPYGPCDPAAKGGHR